jgi:hypothetical protein
MHNKIPKEDLNYILEPLKEDKEEYNKQIISEKIIAIVKDINGKIIDKREQKMRSLTQYFLALMSIVILGTYSGGTGATATGILTNIFGFPSQISSSCCGAIYFDYSMYLGSGTQPFSPTINSLKAPICWGTGKGCLDFLNENIYYNNNSISDVMSVINKSGNTIAVREIGIQSTITVVNTQYTGVIVMTSSNSYTNITNSYYLSYDTFNTPILIPNGSSASFQIIINFSG